ncbi:MAG: sigma-70 family RNA polymerase sigma factor [Pirellulales bacterium]|nr:sigma-70 family RNA polymerase sigma factor [Pirellulales bacterium]
MAETSSGVTILLKKVADGDAAVEDELFRRVETELRKIAKRHMRGERSDHTLQPTALVDEAFLRVLHADRKIEWRDRREFFRTASQAMRRILVEYARVRLRKKRGGGQRPVRVDDLSQFPAAESPEDIVALDEALAKLARRDPRAAEVVELRFLWNCTIQETAKIIGCSDRTVKNDWNSARAFLMGELTVVNDEN